MMSSRLRWLALQLATSLPALEHSEAEAPAGHLLDCEHPPADLAHGLPKQLADAATLVCLPAAQMIVAREGWAWRFPGSFFDRPSIPAYTPIESRAAADGRYFTGFSATELSRAEINSLHESLVNTLVTYADAAPPERIVKLIAHNDQGFSMDAYFGFKSAVEGWVVLCAPACAPEFFFLINRLD
jgi:hypothetical protein